MAIDSMARGWGNWLKAYFRASSFGGGWLRDEKGECKTREIPISGIRAKS